ncbi:MAG: helix-turn-helix domain-containing protein [Patescibacteria group bacterium]
MILKIEERNQALRLRKKGMSLRDIVKIVPVAKSTLSLWLKEVHLSKPQKQRLTQKKLEAGRRGGIKRKNERIVRTQAIFDEAASDITDLSKKDLWLMGIMLYWAEGSKAKEYRPTCGIKFSNSDPHMLRLFQYWLKEVFMINEDRLNYEIYIHKSSYYSLKKVTRYWSRILKVPLSKLTHIYFKTNKIKTTRHNIGKSYYGLICMRVTKSTDLYRRIEGWIRAIGNYYCRVV